ncbi:ankyrin repeat domain-containing protein [Orientia tsutsugamushi]|uniref:Ankyrin repeats family protein n=1 Tax=Orientia tsutsugamushi str. TA716 TaxID=1359175 RepID=A0A0F3PAF2_ORITS|nr:ankyrin repeat domain-containing protein [Orientia tsutsugamushi]KJV76219.1 ankyrin repeats family protein [Orientia tsutsugamushi str. TA716]
MNPEDIALVQEVAELIQNRQHLQARILVKTRGGFSDNDAATSELYSRVPEELALEFVSFCENMENCRTSDRYAALFLNSDFPINEGEYCSLIAMDFYSQGKLNKQTANSVFGGMVVHSVIRAILVSSMPHHHDTTNMLDTLLHYAINTNLRYNHKGNDESAFESAKMELCSSYLSTIGMNADNTNDHESRARIECILENSGDSNKLLNFNPGVTHTLMFRLLDQDCKESAKLLLDSGLDVSALPPVAGWLTILDAAIERNNYDFAKILVQRGVDIVDDHNNTSSEMKALCNTHQFFKNTGYFKEHKSIPDQMLDDSLEISSFITQDKSLRDSCWPALKSSVNSETLLSQMAYEFRCDPSLLPYFVELTQLKLSKLQLQSAASIDADNKECSSTTHRDKYTARKSSQSTTDLGLK